jgi:hypothetical protein
MKEADGCFVLLGQSTGDVKSNARRSFEVDWTDNGFEDLLHGQSFGDSASVTGANTFAAEIPSIAIGLRMMGDGPFAIY